MKDSNSKVGFLPTTQPLLIASEINWELKTMTVAKLILLTFFTQSRKINVSVAS